MRKAGTAACDHTRTYHELHCVIAVECKNRGGEVGDEEDHDPEQCTAPRFGACLCIKLVLVVREGREGRGKHSQRRERCTEIVQHVVAGAKEGACDEQGDDPHALSEDHVQRTRQEGRRLCREQRRGTCGLGEPLP